MSRYPQTTKLHDAALKGDLEAIDQQLSAGVKINIRNYDRETPLHLAAMFGRVDAIDKLLASGASVHARDKWNNTPLHWAAGSGNVEAIAKLLEAGADIDRRGKLGTPEDNAETMEARQAFDHFRARRQAQALDSATCSIGETAPDILSRDPRSMLSGMNHDQTPVASKARRL